MLQHLNDTQCISSSISSPHGFEPLQADSRGQSRALGLSYQCVHCYVIPLNVCVLVLLGFSPNIAAHCGVLYLNDQTRNHSQVLWYILIHVKIDQRTPVVPLRRAPCQTRVSLCAMVGIYCLIIMASLSFPPGVWSRILLRPGN